MSATGSTIQPETILRELADLWVSLGKEKEPGFSGVLRACTMTLIALVEESEDPADVWSTMAALMPEHPSRALVIRFHSSAGRELASRVFSQCWMPFGQRRQICCEQIEISASDSSLPDLRAVVLPLAVPDLPVILWCRGARLFGLADFPHLAGIACKLVLDSAAFSDPASILGQLHERSHSGQVFGDLAWTRLTHWRELVSQIFESRGCLARLPDIGQVRLVYGGAAPPSGAYYLAAWLLDSLESGGAHAQVNWESAAGAPPGRLARIDLGGAEGNEPRVSIELTGGPDRQSAIVRVGSLSNHAVFPPDNDYVLLREELGIPGRDPVFERSLERAARLAQVEKK